jgi:hypothetical protein
LTETINILEVFSTNNNLYIFVGRKDDLILRLQQHMSTEQNSTSDIVESSSTGETMTSDYQMKANEGNDEKKTISSKVLKNKASFDKENVLQQLNNLSEFVKTVSNAEGNEENGTDKNSNRKMRKLLPRNVIYLDTCANDADIFNN